MDGKFEVYKDKAGKFRYRLVAANGKTIMVGQGYSSRASCLKGIASVKKNSLKASNFQVYQNKSGGYSFRLIAPENKEIIGTGQSYTSSSGCRKGVKSVGKKNARAAKIVDVK